MEIYERLEHELAEWAGYHPNQMVVCSNGTAALHLALEALGLPAGSEVLVPDYTMVACARAVTLAGLTPVFIDCDERLLIDKDVFASQRNSTPDVVMPVHVYGRRVHEDVFYYADQNNWYIVEDLAEAHGVKPHPQTDAACWSFYKNKIVAGEEGGAVAFKDVAHAEVARELRSLGFTKDHDFVHRPKGHNYRMSNLHAGAIWNSLQNVGYELVQRRRVEGWYDELCPKEWQMPPRDAPWVYDFRVPGLRRDRMAGVVAELNKAGIRARMGFYPMSLQPEYAGKTRTVWAENRETPRWYQLADEVFYLPLSPGEVTRKSVRLAFNVIREVLGDMS